MNVAQLPRKITLLAKKTDFVEPFVKSMIELGQEVVHIETCAEAVQLVKGAQCANLVHVLRDFERDEVGLFHHRLVRSEQGRKVNRFIVYREDNTRAIAFALDCGMLKSIQAEAALHTLGASIEVSLQAFDHMTPEAQKLSHLIASGDCNHDEQTCNQISKLSDQFPNWRNLQCASAQLALRNGDLKRATQLIRRVIDEEPSHVRALTILGEILIQAGNLMEANKPLTAAQQLSAGNPRRLLTFAQLYLKLGQAENARKFLVKSIEIRPIPHIVDGLIDEISTSAPDKSQLKQSVDDSLAKIHAAFGE